MTQEYHIEIQPDATPVVHPPRRVPFSLHGKLKGTLDHMEKNGVIAKVDKPTDWVNSLVIAEKKDGSLRLCLDPRGLNKVIKREHYKIPTAEEVASKLSGKSVFSFLDEKDGFWQIPLDEESSFLCTFNSPFGRYRFLRCPFGISSAPEVFQKRNDQLFGDIEGVHVVFDDLIIGGKDDAEHDGILNQVLDRARANNVKFNPDKFQFQVPEVKYIGQVVSSQGLKPDPDKVKAITEYPQPQNTEDLRRFLGLVNYLGEFVSNLSAVSMPLRTLLKNDIAWHWSTGQEKAFQEIKRLLTCAPVLKLFDVHKEVVIETDASKDGLGACLLQESHPVAYASRSLTASEKNYAQIEKELMAIVFTCEKFNQYVYGQPVKVVTDHKPLETLTKKNLNQVSPRLQRMLLRLQRYSLHITYRPGPKIPVPDALSRACLSSESFDEDLQSDMEVLVHNLVKNLPMSAASKSEIQIATAEDDCLVMLQQLAQSGWPSDRRTVPERVRHYWNARDQVHEVEGLMFLREKLIVPAVLRKEMLNLVHESHQGIEKSKARAREVMYWPGMARDIEDTVTRCSKCAEWRRNNQKEPLIPSLLSRTKSLLVRGKNLEPTCLILMGRITCVSWITTPSFLKSVCSQPRQPP